MTINFSKGPIIHPVSDQCCGFTLERIKPEHCGKAETIGFNSFDEGISFFKKLDNFNSLLLSHSINPATIERMLLIFEKKRTLIYFNEMINYHVKIRAKRDINKGAILQLEDIANIESIHFDHIEIPTTDGYFLLLSHNWRKAYAFDFQPLLPGSKQRNYDVEVMAGQLYSHLLYTELFLMSEEEWGKVIKSGWFPFIYLVGDNWNSLYG